MSSSVVAPPSPLTTRKLGKNGPEVTAIGLGLMGLSAFYGPTKSDEERLKFLNAAYEAGETNWDSADMYGDSEDLLGKWFALNPEKRSKIFLATKFANKTDASGGRAVDSTPEYCREACEKSLKRLGVSYIDLYYVHRVDRKTPIEKTMEALVGLQKEGKIKYIGLSEISADTLRRASKIAHVDAIQVEYSPFALEIETPQVDLFRVAKELGTAIVAYSPLGRGMLTGAIKSPNDLTGEGDFRKFWPRFSPENFPKNLVSVDAIAAIAKRKGCTVGQVTLAWLLKQDPSVIPIPGTSKVERLLENLGALGVNLTDEEDKEIRATAEAAEAVHGERYPEQLMASLYADTPALSA
ncbi:aldo-keto reductase, putative [Gonapodya prolifera JEL478]|uniref:Aldo-keto reductase, putative n=1 Tax=Gonapodya prolifera (strain JEL478) TaxID=1344416 RepID=A0A139A1I7_GONPJ|nr:aldo-keto reductase, putative [Gonapodya prolifera JEL478]|eukprot:KXS10223.1 aldo-keto reductase, putative [Gonapodya prolifera JEL478]